MVLQQQAASAAQAASKTQREVGVWGGGAEEDKVWNEGVNGEDRPPYFRSAS